MRTLLTAAGVATAAMIVGVGAYVSQAEPATGTVGTGVTTTSTVSDDAARATTTPAATATATVDDKGGLVDRDLRVEPDDGHGSSHGTDDYGYDDHGSDHD